MPFAQGEVGIHYVDAGTGPETVFFGHGAGGNSTSGCQQTLRSGSGA
jgi:hypothetical protein